LLAVLIALPGIAVCWNLLPKEFRGKSVSTPATPIVEPTQHIHEEAEDTVRFAPLLASPPPAIQQVSWEHFPAKPAQDFESLNLRLKALGATDSKLEHWGNGGELYRFSCFVVPSETCSYEKHFQFIGADAITVMLTVIADIEQWKNSNGSAIAAPNGR